MIISVPTVKKEFKDGEIVREKDTMDLEVDTSFTAHYKWEQHFQKDMGIDLTTHTQNVQKWIMDEDEAKRHFLDLLKLLYCYVDSEKLPTFKHFIRLFDVEVAEEILKRITDVIEAVGATATKN